MSDDKRCKRCGACKECGTTPPVAPNVIYVYPWHWTQPSIAANPYRGNAAGGSSSGTYTWSS